MAHQVYGNNSAGEVIGRIKSLKMAAPSTVILDWINDRIRYIIDRKPFWSGQIRETILYIPTPYTTGTLAFTQNSSNVTGTGVTWPIDDAVNTTVANGVVRLGLNTITPASMDGITPETYLYVDSAGDPEVVGVTSIGPNSFTAYFTKFHNQGCTLTSSSYAGLQIKLANTLPVFSIAAVTSATTLIMDQPWKNTASSGNSYSIRRMYTTIAPDIKGLIAVTDPAQGIPPLRTNVTIMELNRWDPQRSSIGYPQCLAFRSPSTITGNIQYEIWPATQTDRQLRVIYSGQPAKLVSEQDRIPFFISPTVLFNGVMATALSVRIGQEDINYDPAMARDYERKFQEELDNMILVDEEHSATMWGTQFSNSSIGAFGGATFWASHDFDVLSGRF